MSAPPPREISQSALPDALQKDTAEAGIILLSFLWLVQTVMFKFKHQNELMCFSVQITVS